MLGGAHEWLAAEKLDVGIVEAGSELLARKALQGRQDLRGEQPPPRGLGEDCVLLHLLFWALKLAYLLPLRQLLATLMELIADQSRTTNQN